MPSPTTLLDAKRVSLLFVSLCWPIAANGQSDEAAERALLDQSNDVVETIAQHRGIAALSDMDKEVMNRAELVDALQALVDRELSMEAREAQNRVTYALGLVDTPDAWVTRYLGLLETEVAGFYDHETETFYILDDTPEDAQAGVMAHELFHAIQDQHWGIEGLIGHGEFISDVALSAQSLIEGDAVAVMMAYMLGGSEQVTHDSMQRRLMSGAMRSAGELNTVGAPAVMWDQLVFPYADGLQWIFALVKPDDWSAIDAAYLDPPRSTEQILHPERYIERDEPTWLEYVVNAPSADRYLADVFGEMMIASVCTDLLRDHIAPAACDRAADGWDGDRLEAYWFADDAERDLIVWLSVWDDPAEARGFAAIMSRLAQPWLGMAAAEPLENAHGSLWHVAGDDGELHVERWGDLALVVLDRRGTVGPETRSQQVAEVVSSVWASVRRHQYPAMVSAD